MPEVTEMELAALMRGMTDQQRMLFISLYNSGKKDRNIALILSVLIGYMGIDRFYVGDILLGVLKLLTGGCCLLWYIVDWFLIMGRVDEYNRNKAREIAASVRGPGYEGPLQPPPSPGGGSPSAFPPTSGQGERAEPSPSAPPPAAPEPTPRAPAQPQALPANLLVWLEVIQGGTVGQRFFVLTPDNLVGRSSESDIQVIDPSVSRHHFRLKFQNGQFMVQNESAHGTYVNGHPVAHWQPLKDGDYIQAGQVVFQFRMQGST
ncbi:MAG: FHA domain-containing protein [Candidatus Caldarchaeum sp.]